MFSWILTAGSHRQCQTSTSPEIHLKISRWKDDVRKVFKANAKIIKFLQFTPSYLFSMRSRALKTSKFSFLASTYWKTFKWQKETMKKKQQDVLKIDYQSVSHEVDPWSSSGYVVEWVSRLRREYQTEFRSKLDYHNISRSIIITSPW